MSIGHRGMIYAARVLAGTMIDLYRDESARAAIREEFERRTAGHVYKGYIPPGPPPVPGP
jgi:aminobenzoyl-glutamate utilization protein B